MQKRPLCVMALGFLLGILVVKTGNMLYIVPVIGILLFLAGGIRKAKVKWAAGMLLLMYTGCVFTGVYRCYLEQEFIAKYEPALENGRDIKVQGELSEKEFKNNLYQYYLKNCYLKLPQGVIPCNQILVRMEQDTVSIGKVLVLEGEVSTFRQSENEGNFDEAAFYQSQKIAFKLNNPIIIKEYGKTNQIREWLYRLRKRLKNVYVCSIPSEMSGVLVQMTLGDQSLMDTEIKELYQKVGISHILAISGLHISVIGLGIYKLIRRICGNYFLSAGIAGTFMAAYGCMAGFRPSAARAILMFFVMLLADILGRSYDSLSALSFAAIVLLWDNTGWLSYAGFLFSFAAVLGVVLVGKIVNKTVKKDSKIHKSIYSGLSIQLMTLPLSAYFYYEIPLYGMLMNFIVLPFMSVILFVGLAGGIIGLFRLDAAKWVLFPCRILLGFYQAVSTVIQKFPYAVNITGKPALWRLVVYYVLLFGIVWVIAKRKKGRGFGIIGILLLLFVFHRPQAGMELAVISVGQGDGIYLRTSTGQQMFVDGGSTDVSKVGTYRILPFLKCKDVRGIDYWFVSHTDGDHVSGLQELLEGGYPVKHLVFAESVIKDEAYESLIELAEQAGTEVLSMGYLDCLHLKDASITCVFPYEGYRTENSNAASMVLYYEDGDFNGLLTGDIGVEEEAWIAEHNEEWLTTSHIDFYKAAHHGSKYSNGITLLEVLQPEFAVISCGKNNRYGHPHAEAIERLERVGSEIYYTMESGQVTIGMDEEGAWVNEYNGM